MTSINLTWDEARARAALLSVDHYAIDLDLTDGHGKPGESTFLSTTTITFHVKEGAGVDGDAGAQGATTFLDLRARDIHEVILDGTTITDQIDYSPEHGLALRNLTPGAHEITVAAACEYSTSGEGLHRFVNPADGEVYLYTQFEPADAKRVFACFDQPDLKATFSTRVVTPKHWRVVTNGVVSTEVGEVAAVHTAEINYRMSTYLAAFIAGPYYEVRDEWRGVIARHPEVPNPLETLGNAGTTVEEVDGELVATIPLGLYCRKDIAEYMDTERLFRETKEGFDFYAKHFGVPYPFVKYDQIFCPEYNMGAMENCAAVTIREDYIFRSATTQYLYERRNDTILHEMAHMWFGDLVTMEWWNDLWLNESFATWTATQAQTEVSEFTAAWDTFTSVEKAWAYNQDQLPSTHPITTDASDVETVQQNFDGITYAKGASVLKALAFYVGLENFFAGARLHFARHAFGNATFDDLVAAIQETSGKDLSDWATKWLTTTGINHFTVETETEEREGVRYYTRVTVKQSGAAPGEGEVRPHMLTVGVFGRGSNPETAAALGDHAAAPEPDKVYFLAGAVVNLDGESAEVPELVGAPAGDIILPNTSDSTYGLVDLSEADQKFVLENLEKFVPSMYNALLWATIWQHVRDGKVRARDFLALIGRALAAETHPATVQQLVRQTVTAARHYADPEWMAAEGWELTANALLGAARAAAPGSDTQLAAVKELPNIAPTADTVAVARAIIDGNPESVGLPGLPVDTDMKWGALKVLAAASAGENPSKVAVPHAETVNGVENLITRGEERDKSSLGQQAAVVARALIPTAENKARVWDQIMGPGAENLSNRVLLANVEGFVTAGRRDLLAGRREEFFAVVKDVWDRLGGEMALRVLTGMYPAWDTSEEAIAQAEELLARDDLSSGLKRLISEGLFGVRRAARAQAVDRG